MTDPKLPDQTGEPNNDRPAWLLGSIHENQSQQPDLIDPVEDSSAPADQDAPAEDPAPVWPASATSPQREDLELGEDTHATFGDDPQGIIGDQSAPADVEPVTANASTSDFDAPHRDDFQAAADPESAGSEPVEPVGFATAFNPPSDDVESTDPNSPAEDPGAPVDVLANRPMPDSGYQPRREYDLSKLDPESWKGVEEVPDPQVTATADALAGAGAPTTVTAGSAAAAAMADDDLESTKVRRQSLLQSDEVDPEYEQTEAAWHPRAEDNFMRPDDQSIFEESTVIPDVPSRASARLWSLLVTLLLAPLAWYLLSDAAARLTLASANPWQTGQINPAALLELGGGIIVTLVILGYLVRSSLGAIIWGVVIAAGGALFLAVPTLTQQYLTPAEQWLSGWNAFGANVAHHLEWTGSTGVIFTCGLLLLALGIIAIMARRDGKREAEIRAQIERINPGALGKKR